MTDDAAGPGAPEMEALPVVDRESHQDLRDMIGVPTVERLVLRLIELMRAAFHGEARDAVAQEAHGLISTAGMMGCPRLAEVCRRLELAAQGGQDYAALLAEARRTRDLTAAALSGAAPGGPT
ncbi:Hpt domain-containing protein [Methylobacterium oryzisoli]|uniref:Hpt domain-containing protein n=1 Tax=Methylobacterium oryzisoli TaxID=3385502 RepID=UPI00389243A6